MLSAPPIQASSAGTAHLRSVPRYKSGCNKWFKTICWFLSLFFLLCNLCIVLFRYFVFSFQRLFFWTYCCSFISVSFYVFTYLYFLLKYAFMFAFIHGNTYLFIYVFNMFTVVFIHLLNQFIDCFGEWFVFFIDVSSLFSMHSLFHATHNLLYSSGLFHLIMYYLTFTLISLFYWYICWKDFSVHSCICFFHSSIQPNETINEYNMNRTDSVKKWQRKAWINLYLNSKSKNCKDKNLNQEVNRWIF